MALTYPYHLNGEGVPAPCRAEQGRCPFAQWQDHYPTLEEATAASEALLAAHHGERRLLKVTQEEREQLQTAWDACPGEPSREEVQALGAAFTALLDKHLPPEAFTEEPLTPKTLLAVQATTRELFATLTACGSYREETFSGPLRQVVAGAASLLPDDARHFTPAAPIVTRKVAMVLANGSYSWTEAPARKAVPLQEEVEAPQGVAEGAYFTPALLLREEAEAPGFGLRIYRRGPGGLAEAYWLGVKPKKSSLGFVAEGEEEVEITSPEGTVALTLPRYRLTHKPLEKQALISLSPGGAESSSSLESVALHEYCHGIQRGRKLLQERPYSAPREEEEAWDYCSAQGLRRGKHEAGFPQGYMADMSKQELFPVAAEALFVPTGGKGATFYGGKHSPQAEALRQWTAGYFLFLAREGRKLREAGASKPPGE